MLVLLKCWFGDIKSFFLSRLENRDETAAEESYWLDSATYYLDMTN